MHTITSSRRLSLRTITAGTKRLLALAALLTLPTAGAHAALTLDLRSTDSANPKLVYPPAGTDYVLHFELYAVVTGHDADPTNEGVQDAFFSLLSTNTVPPGLKGNLALTLVSPFDGVVTTVTPPITTGSPGTIQDLDGDGDLDVGSNDPTRADGWVFTRATSMQTGQSEYLLARVTFTPTAPFLAGQTDAAVGLRLMTSAIVVPAVWMEDGRAMDPGIGGTYTSGSPVVLAIPEPTTTALVAILATPALLARRRRQTV